MRYWLLKSARYYTRGISPALRDGLVIRWSAPQQISPGDLALLYEMGKPDADSDLAGRKQFEWLFRARTGAIRDEEWGWVADFDAIPFRPLPLDEARIVPEFSAGPGRDMRGGQQEISASLWRKLVTRIDARNPGFGHLVSSRVGLDAAFERELSEHSGVDEAPESAFASQGRGWRRESLLAADARGAIFDEGWAWDIMPERLGLSEPTDKGYHLPGSNLYVDDLLALGRRNLLAVEYELVAHGDRQHGSQQVYEYQRALRSRFPDWRFSALVLAESFNAAEREVAAKLAVETLRIEVTDLGEVRLLSDGFVQGPVSKRRRDLGL